MSVSQKRRATRKGIPLAFKTVDSSKFWRRVLAKTATMVDAHDEVKALSLAEVSHQVFR